MILLKDFLRYNYKVQSDSVARGPKLFSMKNYVIEIMTWKWKMKMKKDAKEDLLIIDAETGLFHIQAHLNAFLQILEYFSQICLGPLARESPCILKKWVKK